jgi:hypothetical protein
MTLKKIIVAAWGIAVVTCLSGSLQAGGAPEGQNTQVAPESPSEIPFCGPQAVRRVLQSFGQNVELWNLVQEIQWPDYKKGASLDALEQALEARGVHARLIKMDPRAEIVWDHPVIVHLATNDKSHYVVWLPPKKQGETPTYWDGAVNSPLGPQSFLTARTGAVLLTSDQTISENPTVGSRTYRNEPRIQMRNYIVGANVVVLGSILGYCLSIRAPSRKSAR